MQSKHSKMELLGSAPVSRALLAMGLPTMIGMMINALYNLVDAYFVGRLGAGQMGAISVAFPLGQAIVGMGLLFGSGAASYISRLLGAGDRETAGAAAGTALYGSVAAGAICIAAALAFLTPLLKLLGATESILPHARSYASVYIGFSIFNVFNVAMNSIATSEGAAKAAMCALLSGAVLNIALDPLFISGLEMGVTGAALATGISQFVSSLVYLTYILRGQSCLRSGLRACRFRAPILREIFKTGAPTLSFQLLTSLSIALSNAQARAYGDAVIAAMGAVTRILSMGSLMVFGFIKGFQPVAGFSYGARKLDRLRASIRIAAVWATLFCAAFGLAAALFSPGIIAQFSGGSAEVACIGRTALRAGGVSFVCFGFYIVYSSLLLALGRGGAGLLLGACRQGIFFAPAILILPRLWGLRGILYAQPLADILSALAALATAVRLHRELFSQRANAARRIGVENTNQR